MPYRVIIYCNSNTVSLGVLKFVFWGGGVLFVCLFVLAIQIGVLSMKGEMVLAFEDDSFIFPEVSASHSCCPLLPHHPLLESF